MAGAFETGAFQTSAFQVDSTFTSGQREPGGSGTPGGIPPYSSGIRKLLTKAGANGKAARSAGQRNEAENTAFVSIKTTPSPQRADLSHKAKELRGMGQSLLGRAGAHGSVGGRSPAIQRISNSGAYAATVAGSS